MTIDTYVESVLNKHPEFVLSTNEKIADEYAEQIKKTQEEFAMRIETAKANWIRNRGIEAYSEKADWIREEILKKMPRWAYIKNIKLGGDEFEVEIDLLSGKWSLIPV